MNHTDRVNQLFLLSYLKDFAKIQQYVASQFSQVINMRSKTFFHLKELVLRGSLDQLQQPQPVKMRVTSNWRKVPLVFI